ncbi:hypothetical protein V1264_008060 [Littorina saxatilis]|uniref:Uncharacterized protein n=1 Tax=Littorina saxatilis TaxID=31220 RepID=A0AAN9ASC2_9CAEN
MLTKLIVVCCVLVATNALPACSPDICFRVLCAAVTPDSCTGTVVKHGGFCGCCDACVTGLKLGETCLSVLLLGAPNSGACGPDLYCDKTTNTCQASPLAG